MYHLSAYVCLPYLLFSHVVWYLPVYFYPSPFSAWPLTFVAVLCLPPALPPPGCLDANSEATDVTTNGQLELEAQEDGLDIGPCSSPGVASPASAYAPSPDENSPGEPLLHRCSRALFDLWQVWCPHWLCF